MEMFLKTIFIYVLMSMGWAIGVRFPAGAEIFPFTTMSRLGLGPTQPPI
jgi:hypothetical protein